MSKKWMLLACLLLAPGAASAGQATSGKDAPPENVTTMRVDGEIAVGPGGRVEDYAITTELADELRAILDKAVRGWTFPPMTVDGQPALVRNRMRVTLAARQIDGGYVLSIDNVTFRPESGPGAVDRVGASGARRTAGVRISATRMPVPAYPAPLARAGVEGAVLLGIRIAPDGSVEDAVVVQSSLFNVRGRRWVLDEARRQFEGAALAAIRRWTFDVAADPGSDPTPSARTVMMPVWFAMEGMDTHDAVGQWRTELRSARHRLPWIAYDNDKAQRIGISDVGPGELLALEATLRPPEGVIGRAL